ncbi:MAG: hypothetical protein V3U54_13115 [Thermodesulfobacteriota bacterium]
MTEILTLDDITKIGYLPLDVIVNADFVDFLSVVKTEDAINLVVSNFPYNKQTENWERPTDLAAMWKHLDRVLTDVATSVFTSVEPLTSLIRMSNRGNTLYSDLIWQKEGITKDFVFADIHRAHENVLIFHTTNSHFKSSVKKINSILTFSNRWKLYEWIILSFSEPMDIVLINSAWWVNTALICQQNNRHYIVVEADMEVCKVALTGLEPKHQKEMTKETTKEKVTEGSLFDMFKV